MYRNLSKQAVRLSHQFLMSKGSASAEKTLLHVNAVTRMRRFSSSQRMATDDAKELYKSRPSIAEFPNADCRNRGLQQFRVRGLVKVKAQVLWHALTFNLMRMLNLGYLQKLS